jgi:type II restriction enzyme
MSRIKAGSTPTLCLLERNEEWAVRSLVAIHSSFLTPWVIEERRPLGPNARRAGWIGCNIRLDRIPADGEIAVVENGTAYPRQTLRQRFQRYLPLSSLSANERGWTILTLGIVRSLSKKTFTLSDVYAREHEFSNAYPKNRHVRDKIRQQLQILRDLGVIAFEGQGQYRILT